MSHKKALLASSLTVCSASTSFAVSSHEGSVAYAEDYLQQLPSHPSPKMELNESTQQYLKPVTMDLVDQSIQKSSKSITYKVKKGDTLYQIGLFFGIHYQDLAEFNHIVDPRKLQVGQELVIPLQIEEIPIDKPMTVPQLAKAYHTTVELMVYLNPIFQEQTVTEKGQWIAVPKKMKRAYRKLHQPLPQTQKLPKKKAKRKVVVFPESTTPKPSSYLFCWPVKGQITSKFGWRHGRQHKGIDIWNVAQSRALIYASKAGVVTRAGYTNGYGNLVVIDHGNGWVTYYAHLSKIRVGKGQRIETGQVVGNMGKTGNATGYHLHFEIRKNGEAINPLSMLP